MLTGIACFIWLLFAAAAVRYRRGRSPLLGLSALFVALSQTINVDSVYTRLDSALGGQDLADLAKFVCFVLGVYLLGEHVKDGAGRRRLTRASLAALVSVQVAQSVAFLLISGRDGTTHFMETYGTQVAAFAYSQIHFLFFGVTIAMTGYVALHSDIRKQLPLLRYGLISLVVASAISLVTVAATLIRDIARLSGTEHVADAAHAVYKVGVPLIALFITIGLSLPPVHAMVHRVGRAPSAADVARLARAHDRLLMSIPEEDRPVTFPQPSIQRLCVEIRDAAIVSAARLTPSEVRLLDQVEDRLVRDFRARSVDVSDTKVS